MLLQNLIKIRLGREIASSSCVPCVFVVVVVLVRGMKPICFR